jgi:putative peptidoglycan lipid II flippase
VQISSTVDSIIASWLPAGSVAAFGYGQVIYLLPISLFSMSVAAAELPALSGATGTAEEVAAVLRKRLTAGLRRIAFFVVPSAVAFLVLGDVVAGAVFQSGRFTHSDAQEVWAVLAGASVGLLASSLGRLYSSGLYALLDMRTPLRLAFVRLAITATLGYLFALPLPRALGIDPKWGTAGLTSSAGIAGWVEFAFLRRAMNRRIGTTGLPIAHAWKLWAAGFAAALPAYGSKLLVVSAMGPKHPLVMALVALPIYGALYFGITHAMGMDEARSTIGLITRRFAR